MKTIELQVPDGYELKQVAEGKWELVKSDKDIYDILKNNATFASTGLFFKNGLDSEQMKQRVDRVIALSKLQCVADYLNEGWEPNWEDIDYKWFILYTSYNGKCSVECWRNNTYGQVAFKSREIAQRAMEICGEELIKTALGV